MLTGPKYDVAVVGAGVFGSWTAYHLCRQGARVILIDAYGPGNSRASSGGESRIIRMGYGPDDIYTLSAKRSLDLWLTLIDEDEKPRTKSHLLTDNPPNQSPLFQRTGVLWLARQIDAYCEATLTTLIRLGLRCERLDRSELNQRFSQFELGPVAWGIVEPDAGVLLARRAVQAVAAQACSNGVAYLEDSVRPPQVHTELESFVTVRGVEIVADRFVFACGPWLPKLFPDVLDRLIHITRQEVFFFGVPASDDRFTPHQMPAWVDFNDLVYGIPNLDGRGFKIAIDAHGPAFDPDSGDRIVSQTGLSIVRSYLKQRLPVLANAPVTETRVCQYENTSNGDFLIDRHPVLENVWLVGGGSGHGFKHGPAVGAYVADLMSGNGVVQKRFTLATKETVQHRKVY